MTKRQFNCPSCKIPILVMENSITIDRDRLKIKQDEPITVQDGEEFTIVIPHGHENLNTEQDKTDLNDGSSWKVTGK